MPLNQPAALKSTLSKAIVFVLMWCFASTAFPKEVWAADGKISDGKISFVNDIVPVLTKAGCNAGACHAKAGGGQNGFQLSLLGFESAEDFEHLVMEGRGRRISLTNPSQSLLLLKASGEIAHGGGKRLPKSSQGYALMLNWIRQGMPMDLPSGPKLVGVDLEPKKVSFRPNQEQQLKAMARYSDGTVRDVTSQALYFSNDNAMAQVSEGGLVKALDITGKVAVMVRYQGVVTVFNALIPLGAPIEQFPVAKNFVDEAVFANLKLLGIPPSEVCDDATFVRRVSLDISGRLPSEEETKAFLANKSAGKRGQWIEELLRSPDYADFFAGKWTAVLKNRRDDASDIVSNFAFHAWVRDSLLANKPYDQFVRELLAATGTVVGNPPVAWYKRVKEPKDQIEDVAQLFLGVRMQCAQCHHHPFERWSQDDYYSLAAFFSQVGRKPSETRGEDLIFHKRGMAVAKNIKSGLSLKPAALGDQVAAIAPDEDPRLRLADWLRSPKNPFFAKALVNRYWKHFFQRGLIEPEDDIRESNPASNPELLAALEKRFIESGFDLKDLVRVITTSNAYQLSALPNKHNVGDRQNYSRYYPRRLPAEVMLDAVDKLAGTQTDFANLPSGTRAVALPDNSYNNNPFLRVFGRPEGESVCECERIQSSSLAQSLFMINANDIRQKLANQSTGRAQRLANDKRPAKEKIEELYFAAFGRQPRPDELQTALNYLTEKRINAQGKPVDAGRAAFENYQDLIWALMNSKEFLFNH
ncbi:MAG: DUF1549 and DUF1553 domain-containing protein [Planctomycetota bacterium]|nr:DUF1549 and DUF1553 domain-containing protein [Planctomycetota bacterium]